MRSFFSTRRLLVLVQVATVFLVALAPQQSHAWDNKAHRAAVQISLELVDLKISKLVQQIFRNGYGNATYLDVVGSPNDPLIKPESGYRGDEYQYEDKRILFDPLRVEPGSARPDLSQYLAELVSRLRHPEWLSPRDRALNLMRLLRLLPELGHPPHCGSLYGGAYKKDSDNHGYRVWVKYQRLTAAGQSEEWSTKSLRIFWNSVLDSRIEYGHDGVEEGTAFANFLSELKNLPGHRPDLNAFDLSRANATFQLWADQTAWLDMKFVYSPLADELSVRRDKGNPIQLTSSYIYQALTVAEERLISSSYWLASVLNALFNNTTESQWLAN